MKDETANYPALHANGLERAEYANTNWRVKVPEGTPKEALTNETFWANNARLMNIYDRVEVIPLDGSWFAELLVLDKSDHWARLTILRFVELETVVVSDDIPSGYSIKWKGPVLRWVILRDADSKPMTAKKMQTKAEAIEWLQDHMRSKAA